MFSIIAFLVHSLETPLSILIRLSIDYFIFSKFELKVIICGELSTFLSIQQGAFHLFEAMAADLLFPFVMVRRIWPANDAFPPASFRKNR